MNAENTLYAYISAFIEGLSFAGLGDVCICPGSRSAPLAMLFEAHPGIRVWMHVDERSCAFFALGMAKQSGSPVGALCTSGTAAANFLPAAVEALHARVPLLLLTADRPPELQNVGANQTIDQVDLFGKHVKSFFQAPLPDASPQALRHIRALAAQSISTALTEPRGPVHLNFPFREPLVPTPQSKSADHLLMQALNEPPVRSTSFQKNPAHAKGAVDISSGKAYLDETSVQTLASDLVASPRGLIICGPQTDSRFPSAVVNLARSLDFPLLADPLSQVRCGRHDRSLVIDSYDAFLRDQGVADSLAVDVVLRFGAMPRSKSLAEYLQRQAQRQIVIAPSPPAPDPTLSLTDVIYADPTSLSAALSQYVVRLHPPNTLTLAPEEDNGRTPDASRLTPHASCGSWLKTNHLARLATSRHFASLGELFEGKVFAELQALLPEEALVFVGNSMPVRDLETFFPSTAKNVRFHANYGASGIDGVTSTALGAASVSNVPAFLVTGDLSFYHDLNALLAAKLHQLNLTVVLLNNDGGGIFSFLPQASHLSQFETLFGTPHGLDFRPIVEAFGGAYRAIGDWGDLRAALTEPTSRFRVLEIKTDRQRNVELHREVWASVASALEPEAVT